MKQKPKGCLNVTNYATGHELNSKELQQLVTHAPHNRNWQVTNVNYSFQLHPRIPFTNKEGSIAELDFYRSEKHLLILNDFLGQ